MFKIIINLLSQIFPARRQAGLPGMKSKEVIEKVGEVIEALPSTLFRVKLEDGSEVLTHLAGKMRLNFIKVLVGDKVLVELSPYNLQKGRIIRRLS